MATGEDDDIPQARAYRVHLLDASGRIRTTVPIMAVDDLDAFRQARDLTLTHTLELWEGERRVTVKQKLE